jgi:hypothetical protein
VLSYLLAEDPYFGVIKRSISALSLAPTNTTIVESRIHIINPMTAPERFVSLELMNGLSCRLSLPAGTGP